MTDQEAIGILLRKVDHTTDEYCNAIVRAVNRLIECQWHEYVENDPSIYNNMIDVLLDIEYEDGSRGTVRGCGSYSAERGVYYEPAFKSYFTERAAIKHWMPYPKYSRKNDG